MPDSSAMMLLASMCVVVVEHCGADVGHEVFFDG
jgi:hypothetical protein